MGSILLVMLQFALIAGLLWPLHPGPWSPTALVLLAAGALLGAAAIEANRPGNFNIRPEAKVEGQLVERGPYRYVRHPMYVALLLAAAGLVLRDPGLWHVLMLVALAVVLHLKTIIEEASMLERHPDYAAYRARTGRWVPRVW